MTTGKKTSQSGKTAKPHGAAKPRAIIEGSAEDVTPKTAEVKGKPKDAAAVTDSAAKTSKPKSESPPRQSPERRGVGALVAAGLTGGIAALAIAALVVTAGGPPHNWLARVTGAQDAAGLAREASDFTRSSAAKLETAIASQQTDLKSLKAGLAAYEAFGGEISQIKATLDGLGELPAQTTALTLRITAAETRLDTIAANAAARSQTVNSLARALDGAAKAGTSAKAVSAALALAVSRLDKAETGLAKMKRDIEKLSQSPPPDVSQRAKTETRLADLARQVDALTARIASDETDRLTARFNALKTAIAAGRPFADLLTPFAASPVAAKLAEYAAAGAPTLDSLTAGLDRLPAQPPDASGIDGPIGRITSLFGDAIKIRRTGESASASSPMAAAQTALDAGKVAQAASIVSEAIKGPKAQAWVAAARIRADIDAAVSELEASLDPTSGKSGG